MQKWTIPSSPVHYAWVGHSVRPFWERAVLGQAIRTASTVNSRPLRGKGPWRCFQEPITRFLITVLAEPAHLAAHGANEKDVDLTRERFPFLLLQGRKCLLGKFFLILIGMLAGLKDSLG